MSNRKIKRYISKALKNGFEKDKIKEKILEAGYNKEYIEEIFNEIEQQTIKKIRPIKFEFKKEKKLEPKIIKETPDPIIMENKEMGLKDRVSAIDQKLDMLTNKNLLDKKQMKQFRLPPKVKRQLKKLGIKNKLMVIHLTRNRSIIPMVTEIVNGFISINGNPHNASVDFIFLWKGKYPTIVIKEWDIEPVGTLDYYNAVKDKRIADPMAIAIRMIESSGDLMKKMKLSPKALIFIGLAIIAVIYVLMGGTG